jgi:molybdopterin converting factor small subunit
MIKVWMHSMFLSGSTKHVSDLSLNTDSDISLGELLARVCEGDEKLLFKLVDEQRNLRAHVNVFIGSTNSKNLNGIDTIVSRSDEVSVFPALSGG